MSKNCKLPSRSMFLTTAKYGTLTHKSSPAHTCSHSHTNMSTHTHTPTHPHT